MTLPLKTLNIYVKLITNINAGRVLAPFTAQTGVTGSVVPLRKVSVSKPATLEKGECA